MYSFSRCICFLICSFCNNEIDMFQYIIQISVSMLYIYSYW
jgi:hypothetical protein